MTTPNSRLKALAKELGMTSKDLLVMAPDNDPFNCGTPTHLLDAEWIADLHARHPSLSTHIRRLHYRAFTDGFTLPNGEPYQNDDRTWQWLNKASVRARNLGFMARNEVHDQRSNSWRFAELRVDSWMDSWRRCSSPSASITTVDYDTGRDYLDPLTLHVRPPSPPLYRGSTTEDVRIAVIAEKSTVDDVLVPLCQHLGVDYLAGTGYISHTRIVEFLHRDRERPLRALFISDFDPAGNSMPTAFARMCEFMASEGPADVAVEPLALTVDQVRELHLPIAPLAPTKDVGVLGKRAKFKALFGVEGAVELDAMEALHPGHLAILVKAKVKELRDPTFIPRMEDARRMASAMVAEVWQEHREPIESVGEQVQAQLDDAAAQYRRIIESIMESDEMAELGELTKALDRQLAQLRLPERPQPHRDDREHDWLFRSDRDYLGQLNHYRRGVA